VEGAFSKRGAVATTWSHDSHNLLVLGNDIEAMVRVQNEVLALQGGYCVSDHEKIIANLPLALGGIVALQPITQLGKELSNVRSALAALGYKNQNEIMSVSTLSLVVSPTLKLTDRGLYNVKTHQFEPLIIDEM
jgi:adenine deaminase